MKKLKSIASGVILSASLFGFASAGNAEASGFSLGKQYENGGYEVEAQQPVTEAWSFNSRYASAVSGELHSKYTPLNKVNILQTVLDSDGTYYTIESGKGAKPAIVAYAASGIKQWSYTPVRGAQNLVLGNDNKVYFRDMTNLYAINKADGSLALNVEVPSSGTSPGNFPSVTIDKDGTIYANGLNELSAISPDGTIKWTKSFKQNVTSYVKIDKEGNLFVSTATAIRSISKDGEIIWSKYLENDKLGNVELLDNNQLLVTATYKTPYAHIIDRSTGATVKKVDLPANVRNVTVSDLDGSVYVAGDNLSVFDKDFNSKFVINKKVDKVLLDKENTAVFTVANDGLYAIKTDGSQKWSYAPATATHNWTSYPVMDSEGKVYAGLREVEATGDAFSMVVVGSKEVSACGRISVLLNSQLNKDIPNYEYHATPFYNANVCNGTLTFQFESSDPSILAQKDVHVADAKAKLANTGSFANHVKFIWKDVKTNTVLHEQAQ